MSGGSTIWAVLSKGGHSDASNGTLQNCQHFALCGCRREHIRRREILAGCRGNKLGAPPRRSPSLLRPVVLALGVFSSLCVLFGAYLAWHLGALARTTPQAIGALGWALFAYQLLGVYVSFNELSGLVRILAVVLAICTGWAAWLSRGARSASRTVR